eukprot:4273876-Alexandrium_andersonii.AAC.1
MCVQGRNRDRAALARSVANSRRPCALPRRSSAAKRSPCEDHCTAAVGGCAMPAWEHAGMRVWVALTRRGLCMKYLVAVVGEGHSGRGRLSLIHI